MSVTTCHLSGRTNPLPAVHPNGLKSCRTCSFRSAKDSPTPALRSTRTESRSARCSADVPVLLAPRCTLRGRFVTREVYGRCSAPDPRTPKAGVAGPRLPSPRADLRGDPAVGQREAEESGGRRLHVGEF